MKSNADASKPNYSVFEYLISGVEDKSLYLDSPSPYLLQKPSKAASQSFTTLVDNLKALGINASSLWRKCAAILHLRSIQFIASPNPNEACRVKNSNVLVQVADLLGVTCEVLEGALVSKIKTINNDLISEYLGK